MHSRTIRQARLTRRLTELEQDGFDACERLPYGIKVACTQCSALSINGVACHETGCPNELAARKRKEIEDDLDG